MKLFFKSAALLIGCQILFLSCQSLLDDNGNQSDRPVVHRDGSAEYPFLTGDIYPDNDLSSYYLGNSSPVWIEGYIVGYVSGTKISSVVFDSGDKETNIVIGESPNDPKILIPVQLSSSGEGASSARSELNLSSNPDNLGRHVKIYGPLAKYMSVTGIKPAGDYSWYEDN